MTAPVYAETSEFRVGECQAIPSRNLLLRNGEEHHLEPKVMQLLCYLAANPGCVHTRQTLIDKVWKVDFGADESLTRAISLLRKALGHSCSNVYIETVPKRGYRLAAPVEVAATGSEAPTNQGEPAGRRAWRATALPFQRRRRFSLPFAAAAAMMLSLISAIAVSPPMREPRITDIAPVPVQQMIAVMPFDDLSPQGDQTYFADGLAEDLIHGLVADSAYSVVARSSSFALRDQSMNAPQIGRTLGADALIEGSVRRAGDRVRVTAQLVDTRTGATMWSENFDYEFTDEFTVQDAIAGEIVSALAGRMTDGPSEQIYLSNLPTGPADGEECPESRRPKII